MQPCYVSKLWVPLCQIHLLLLKLTFFKANVTVILTLYRGDKPNKVSVPTITIGGRDNRMRAAVVRTYYDSDLERTMLETTIKGAICAS